MAWQVANVPRPHELLCEYCGYGVDGLPDAGLCPECGKPVADSTLAPQRKPSAWETRALPLIRAFLQTTLDVLRHPKTFYRQTSSRGDPSATVGFAHAHYLLAGYLFAFAAIMHIFFLANVRFNASSTLLFGLLGSTLLFPLLSALITGIRALAAFLSTFESKYHGLRLPLPVVQRALHFHAANLLPVALITTTITAGYRFGQFLNLIPTGHEVAYLSTLAGWIILAALYLFWTYWAAMKAIMYANR